MEAKEGFLLALNQQAIYLMGISFILGSMATIFVLLVLDMVRRIRGDIAAVPPPDAEEQDSPDGAQ